MSSPESSSFTEIPTLPLSASFDPSKKPKFLEDLRHALILVGFFYISDLEPQEGESKPIRGIPKALSNDVVNETQGFFDEEKLPQGEKWKIEMKNEKSFLGWSRLDNELTAGRPDHREQLDLATPKTLPPPEITRDRPWLNLFSPNQWPAKSCLPQFRPVMEDYMSRMSEISQYVTTLMAEALGMESDAFSKFFDENQTHKMKLIKYPNVAGGEGQGVGPHKDSMLSSYLLQASQHRGLQAQNTAGEWVDCPPKDGTLVVAIGQGMEAITGGVCASTTHRVLSPEAGLGPRFSIPFFQGVSFDAKFEGMDVPEGIRELKRQAVERHGGRKDDVEFTFVKGRWQNLGEATLMNRIKSHQDVGERWYPERLAQIRLDQAREAKVRLAPGSANVPESKIDARPTIIQAH